MMQSRHYYITKDLKGREGAQLMLEKVMEIDGGDLVIKVRLRVRPLRRL